MSRSVVSAYTVINALIIALGLTIGIGHQGYSEQVNILSASIERAPLPPVALADTLYFWDSGLIGIGCRVITPGANIPDPLALKAALMGHIGDNR